LATVLFLAAVTSFLTGLLADLISINRTLLEDILLRLRRQELQPRRGDQETAKTPDSRTLT
jgi:hypothetical protein